MTGPAPAVDELLTDLDAERAALTATLRGIEQSAWRTPTRAVGWSVRDQIAHLAFFDAAFTRAIATPEAFVVERDAITDTQAFVDHANGTLPPGGPEVLERWHDAAAAFDRAAADLASAEPKARLPWYGPPMSLRSAITSRIMETWAHGSDVADALGVRSAPTDRLRHVVDLAVRARAQGYRARGLEVPSAPVTVRLTLPSGAAWSSADDADDAGAPDAPADSIRGDAEEFALVLVRRMHVDDTALEITGAAARQWLEIGQMFAGPPGRDPQRRGADA